MSPDQDGTELMPAAFIGHGNPMNALETNRYTQAWHAFGRAVPRPRAILVVSAHWYINATAVTAMPKPRSWGSPWITAPLSRSYATVVAMSSHIKDSSVCRLFDQPSPDVGCTPTSLRPERKISQFEGSSPPSPPDASSDTNGQRRTSRKKARVAVGSSE